MSLSLTCQILGRLVNTLAAEEKYPVLNRDNLTISIQIQLSEKQETYYQFFPAYLKYDPHRFCISEIANCENVVREMSKTSRFRGLFYKQHGKRAQALSKSASQHLYHIPWSLSSRLSWKKSPFWVAKFWVCLLTHCLPMKSILFLRETI